MESRAVQELAERLRLLQRGVSLHPRQQARRTRLKPAAPRMPSSWRASPRALFSEFSRRTSRSRRRLRDLGITRPETRGELGKTTREKKKTHGLSWEDLMQGWKARLRPGELQAIHDSRFRNPDARVRV